MAFGRRSSWHEIEGAGHQPVTKPAFDQAVGANIKGGSDVRLTTEGIRPTSGRLFVMLSGLEVN